MPKYAYWCEECSQVFEVIHSYKEKQQDCILCGKSGCVSKFLSHPVNVLKKGFKNQGAKKTGSAVHKAIEENKQKLKKQKKDLKDKR